QLSCGNLDFPGGQLWIGHALRAQARLSLSRYDVLAPQAACTFVGLLPDLRVENNLGYSLAVPQVKEYQSAVIAPFLHPSHQYGFTADVLSPQTVAVRRLAPSAELIERNLAFLNFCSFVVEKIIPALGFKQIHRVSSPIAQSLNCFNASTIPSRGNTLWVLISISRNWISRRIISSSPRMITYRAPDLSARRIWLLRLRPS